jgi:Na+-translocating ferredoxin:NAD+ oxidoreductase RNF subunit RnfB
MDVLTRVTQGRGRAEDLATLEEIGEVMQDCCLCALGTSAPNPVISTLRYFRDEYDAHIHHKVCPAGACTELIEYAIEEAKCDGCHACVSSCPVDALTGEVKALHTLDREKCIKCGACVEACKRDAILTRTRHWSGEPVAAGGAQ